MEAVRANPETTKTPALAATRTPKSPHQVTADSIEDLLPFLDAVARRGPVSGGLHAVWDLQPGQAIQLWVDSWYDPIVIEAAIKTLEKFGCKYEVVRVDRGDRREYDGHDEVDFFMNLTKDTFDLFDEWERMDAEGKFDKIIWGLGGSILDSRKLQIARFPFLTPEMVMSAANTLPIEILNAIDVWTWKRCRAARRIHITDPEGTDLHYRDPDEAYDAKREFYADDLMRKWYPRSTRWERTYTPGHIAARPSFFLPEHLEDGFGQFGGTMNHIGPYPQIRMRMEGSRVTEISGGGRIGDKLRDIFDRTRELKYPEMPGKGLMSWVEAAIGTNPHIHRPRNGYLRGWISNLNERMHSGVVHLGYGTAMVSEPEKQAAEEGKLVGHWHVHLYFPTLEVEFNDGGKELVIKDGRLLALDDPEVRTIAARFGDPDTLLRESWIPAVPGINVEGDYERDYAHDPLKWILADLNLSQNWHRLYEKLVSSDGPHTTASC